jgi:hypothetical protein
MKNFIIAQDPEFTIEDYEKAFDRKNIEDKNTIANAIKRRLIQRYIKPGEISENKNGFNIMANCCLLIESYESLYRGWSKTPNGSDAFCKFFNRSDHFKEFLGNDTPTQFYEHIRCGILHQGETSGGWRIRRDQPKKLDLINKIIDANHFRDDLKKEIEKYFENLTTKDWNENEWKMLFKKMKSIIKNCEK